MYITHTRYPDNYQMQLVIFHIKNMFTQNVYLLSCAYTAIVKPKPDATRFSGLKSKSVINYDPSAFVTIEKRHLIIHAFVGVIKYSSERLRSYFLIH